MCDFALFHVKQRVRSLVRGGLPRGWIGMVYARMGQRGLNFQPVPLLLRSPHPIAAALRTVAPTGARRDIVAALGNRITYDSVRDWLYGRSRPQPWVRDTIAARLMALHSEIMAMPVALSRDEKA